MSKPASFLQLFVFLGFIFGFLIFNIITPSRPYSPTENRFLTEFPDLNIKNLASGKFMSSFDSYASDQFALRDSWTELKARAELSIGKEENKGVYLCDDERLISRFDEPDEVQVNINISAVNELTDKLDIPVHFTLVPGAVEIHKDMLPANAPGASQGELIQKMYDQSNAVPIDVYNGLAAHKSEYIFYRTDHHWTSLGAYYGYSTIISAMGYEPTPLSSFTPQIADSEFYGTAYSSSGFAWVSPDTIETFVIPPDNVSVTTFPEGKAVSGMLYDKSFLEEKDKYAMFMGGNTPLTEITTGKSDLPSILIVRDSYLDSMLPFLLEHFSEIYMIDTRYNKSSLEEYIQEKQPDSVLLCYSAATFFTDANVFLITQ